MIERRRFLQKASIAFSLNIAPFLGIGQLITLSGNTGVGKLAASDLEKIKALLERNEPNIWLFTGDSITQGAKHTHGYRSYPEVFQERIRWELGRVRDIVINTGVSGHTAAQILADFEWRIRQFNPGVVSLMIGTNDCARPEVDTQIFSTYVSELIWRIRDLKAIPVLHTPNPIILNKSSQRKSLPTYIPILRSLAEKEQLILIDNYRYWEEKMKEKSAGTVFKNWLNDPLHPNQYGHQEVARLMFKELGIFDPTAASCGGAYYEGDH